MNPAARPIAFALLALALAVPVFFQVPFPGRYQLGGMGKHGMAAILLDTWTGRTWLVGSSENPGAGLASYGWRRMPMMESAAE